MPAAPINQEALGLKILYQSDQDMVVIKPAGMATELTSDPRKVSLISRVRASLPNSINPRLVHRLDRVTRGVMVVALTREAAAFHGEQIRESIWDKYYLARIPRPDPKSNPLHDGIIGKHKAFLREENKRARLVRSGGKPSMLEVLAVEPAPGRNDQCHALIRLYTGRLHQIRIMLAGLGLPLIGDRFYGGRDGSLYLEHIALWQVDYTTREMRLAHFADDPDREPLSPKMSDAIALITKPGARRL